MIISTRGLSRQILLPVGVLLWANEAVAQLVSGIPAPSPTLPSDKTLADVWPENSVGAGQIKRGQRTTYQIKGGRVQSSQAVVWISASARDGDASRSETLIYPDSNLPISQENLFAHVQYKNCKNFSFRDYFFFPSRQSSITSVRGVDENEITHNVYCKTMDEGEQYYTQPKGTRLASNATFFKNLNGYYFYQSWRVKTSSQNQRIDTYLGTDGKTTVTVTYFSGKVDNISISKSIEENVIEAGGKELSYIDDSGDPPFFLGNLKEEYNSLILRRNDVAAQFRSSSPAKVSGNWRFGRDEQVAQVWAQRTIELETAAGRGDSEAMLSLFSRGLNGSPDIGIVPNGKLALEWVRRAAMAGNAQAQNYMGLAYAEGYWKNSRNERISAGLDQSNNLARFWYQKASDQGYVQAGENLATLNNNEEVRAAREARAAEQERQRQDSMRQALGVMIQQQQIQAQQEQARREAAERRRAQEAQLQAQREQTAAYERQQAANRQAADQRAFEERRATAIQAQQSQQQQLGQTSVPAQGYSQAQQGNQSSGASGGNSQAQVDAERRRQEQLAQERQRQQQLQAAKANPSFRHRMEDTRTGYAVVITNPNQFDIQCSATIDGYRWVGTRQEIYRSTDPIYVSAGSEGRYEWSMQRVGARYTVSSCQGR